jgi:hypothetical protein
MKRLHPFVVASGLIGMLANSLSILGHLAGWWALPGGRIDPGLVLAVTFVIMAYGLAVWAALAWRWAHARPVPADALARRAATLLLTTLAAFPLITLWLNLLFSVVWYTDVATPDRWLLALAHAWMVTPFAALGLTFAADVVGPLLSEPPTRS